MKEEKSFGLSGIFIKESSHHAKISAKQVAEKLRRKGYKTRVTESTRDVWFKWIVWKQPSYYIPSKDAKKR